MHSKEIKYFSYLEKIAAAIDPSTINRVKFASCLVYKNEIVSIGVNKLKSHPFQSRFAKNSDAIFLHSETDCIKNALKIINTTELSKSSLYICRVKYHDESRRKHVWGLSKPCEGCQRAIATFGIKTVAYTCDGGNYKYL